MVGSFYLTPRIRNPRINRGEVIEIDVFITGVGDAPTDVKLNTSYPASILRTDEKGYVGFVQTCVIVQKDRNNKIVGIATGDTKLKDSQTGEMVSAIQKFPQSETGSSFSLNEGFFISSQIIYQLQGKKIDVRDKRIMGESTWDGYPPIYIKLNTSTDALSGDHDIQLTLFFHEGNTIQSNQRAVVVHIKSGIEQHQRSLQWGAVIIGVIALLSGLIQTYYTILQYFKCV